MGFLKNVFAKKEGGTAFGNKIRDLGTGIAHAVTSPIEAVAGKDFYKENFRSPELAKAGVTAGKWAGAMGKAAASVIGVAAINKGVNAANNSNMSNGLKNFTGDLGSSLQSRLNMANEGIPMENIGVSLTGKSSILHQDEVQTLIPDTMQNNFLGLGKSKEERQTDRTDKKGNLTIFDKLEVWMKDKPGQFWTVVIVVIGGIATAVYFLAKPKKRRGYRY